MERWAKSKCEKIIYLVMEAPPGPGHLYFNSALEAGFTEMFIALVKSGKEFYPKEGPCPVKALKARYTDDGFMDDDDGTDVRMVKDGKVKVLDQPWFFCKPKIPTLHVKCTNL